MTYGIVENWRVKVNNETYIKALESRIVDLNGVIDSLRIQMDRLKEVQRISTDPIVVGPVTRQEAISALSTCRFSLTTEDAQKLLTNFACIRKLL